MYHQSTTLEINKPILLISGANGSGKSQIIESLQLAFGELSQRAKKLGLDALIHPAANPRRAIIEVTVNNTDVNFSQLMHTDLLYLKPIFESSEVIFRATITSQKISRAVGAKGIFHEIRQRDLRRILSPLGVRPNNQLTFTLAETIEIFSQESPYKKFQVLLENLGLLDLKEQIVSNESVLNDTLKETTRLEAKLREEESNLILFKELRESIQQRTKLESRVEELKLEQKWVEVYYLESEHIILQNKQTSINQSFNTLIVELNSYQLSINENTSKLLNSKNLAKELQKKLREIGKLKSEIDSNFSMLRGKISTLEVQTKEKEQEILVIESAIQNKGQLSSVQREIKIVEDKLKTNRSDLATGQEELATLEEESKIQEARLSRIEQDLIEECLKLRAQLQSAGLISQVLGPIIELIHIAPQHQKWESPAKQLIGDYLFSFVALTPDAFDKVKSLYDSLFLNHKPGFHVFLFSSQERAERKLDDAIYAFVPDLLEGNSEIIHTLRNVMNSAVAYNGIPRDLAIASKKTRLFILTQDGASYYTPAGSFTRPPREIQSALGLLLREPIEAKKLSSRKKELQDKIHLMQRDQQKLISELGKIREKMSLFSTSEYQLYTQKAQLEKDIDKISQEIKHTIAQEAEFSQSLEKFDAELVEVKKQVEEEESKQEDLNKTISIMEAELKVRSEKKEDILQQLNEITEEITSNQKNLNEKVHSLMNFGPRPDQQRPKETIDAELIEIQTKLAMIQNKSLNLDRIQQQEKLVEDLQTEFADRRLHLENLRKDLQLRKEEWIKQIKPFLITLNDKFLELSKDLFQQTRVFIEPEDLDKAGLVLQAVTKSKWRTDVALSSGEKVLLMECLILSLHALSNSPVHAIDEFSQRLDLKNKNKIFRVVDRLVTIYKNAISLPVQFILLTQDVFGLDLGENIQHIVFAQAKDFK